MAICRYWQQGTCTYGNSCRFEHVGHNPGNAFAGSGQSGFGQGSVKILIFSNIAEEEIAERKEFIIV
jgi:hypothetical protein